MYKENFASNIQGRLICHKTKPNQTKPNPIYLIKMYKENFALNNQGRLICHQTKICFKFFIML